MHHKGLAICCIFYHSATLKKRIYYTRAIANSKATHAKTPRIYNHIYGQVITCPYENITNENTTLGSMIRKEFTIAAQRIKQTIIVVDSYENAPACKWPMILKSSTCFTEKPRPY
jgi:hypothetical protein